MWEELQLEIQATSLDEVSERLFSHGCSGLQEDFLPGQTPAPRQPWDTGPRPPLPNLRLLRAWFENPDRERILAELAHLPLAKACWAPVPDIDWENDWKRHFPVLEISPRITIAPPWEAVSGALVIEPGQGFGSGQHPTTRAALVALDALIDEVETVLDLGCGSGILAIAAARLGKPTRGVDIDPVAIVDARGNAARNDVSIDWSTTPIERCAPAELVLANLHAELLVHYAGQLGRLTQKWLVTAGILLEREPLVTQALSPYLELISRHQDGDWISQQWKVR